MNEARDKARLRWLCRRGMKELDVLLERFLAESYEELGAAEQNAFIRLMQMEDPDLYGVLMGRQTAPDHECADVIELLRNVH